MAFLWGCSFDASVESPVGLIEGPDVDAGAILLQDGLVGYWPMDEGAGETLRDLSGSDNQGTIHGAEWVSGVSGSALSFSGTDAYVDLGQSAGLDVTGAITVAAWVRVFESNGFRNIVARGYVSNPDGEFFLRIHNGVYQGGSWDGGDHKAYRAMPDFDVERWTHLASVYDGTAWTLYRDGAMVHTDRDDTGAVPVAGPWAIGARGGGNERHFSGEIDEVRIYDIGLASADVRLLAESGQ
jgi:hypothetical protein